MENPSLQEGYKQILISVWSLITCFQVRNGLFYLFKKRKDYQQKQILRMNHYKKEWDQRSLSGDQIGGGRPKGDRNHEDDPFKVVPSWKLPTMHAACTCWSKCYFCLDFQVPDGESSSSFLLREGRNTGYMEALHLHSGSYVATRDLMVLSSREICKTLYHGQEVLCSHSALLSSW